MDQPAVKIKSYRISSRGKRGAMISVPKVWLDDIGAVPGDKIDVLRTTDNRLILELAPKSVGDTL